MSSVVASIKRNR